MNQQHSAGLLNSDVVLQCKATAASKRTFSNREHRICHECVASYSQSFTYRPKKWYTSLGGHVGGKVDALAWVRRRCKLDIIGTHSDHLDDGGWIDPLATCELSRAQ